MLRMQGSALRGFGPIGFMVEDAGLRVEGLGCRC